MKKGSSPAAMIACALAQKVHDADRWIAATAIARGLDLISDDTVFELTPGLSLVTANRS